ncbi:MAG TPA: glycosyltransferase family 2 protein [bacterium]|nr:glycosyltransferase family 2 protein [bacterium]
MSRSEPPLRAVVVMPLYNEAPTLAGVLDEVRRHTAARILVVNDGSTDGSAEILAAAERRLPDVRGLTHAQNEGYGQSLIDGFRYAIGGGFDVAVTIDCDRQHEPRLIPDFLAAARRFDIVSGSRYHAEAPGDQDPAPPDRQRLNEEITRIIDELTGYRLTDAWCGFKAYRIAGLARMRLDERSYGMPLQVWLQAARLGLTVTEIPVPRIYKNPERRFWGGLDDPQARRTYYLAIIDREVSRWRTSS